MYNIYAIVILILFDIPRFFLNYLCKSKIPHFGCRIVEYLFMVKYLLLCIGLRSATVININRRDGAKYSQTLYVPNGLDRSMFRDCICRPPGESFVSPTSDG